MDSYYIIASTSKILIVVSLCTSLGRKRPKSDINRVCAGVSREGGLVDLGLPRGESSSLKHRLKRKLVKLLFRESGYALNRMITGSEPF